MLPNQIDFWTSKYIEEHLPASKEVSPELVKSIITWTVSKVQDKYKVQL